MMDDMDDVAKEFELTVAVEWMVEYILEIRGSSPIRSVTIIDATDVEQVRNELHRELTSLYPEAGRIDVTVIRMSTISSIDSESMFEEDGIFHP
ncbi:MAG: hypothetical protein VX854_00500 [Candidatus Thermoplasmatota archaeon]|nr:hypothetical protein [Candidatus Thermoplasmatota archaeon]